MEHFFVQQYWEQHSGLSHIKLKNLLLNLLAQDKNHLSPLAWECMISYPTLLMIYFKILILEQVVRKMVNKFLVGNTSHT